MTSLLNEFLDEEVCAYTGDLLLRAIRDKKRETSSFNFNRFDVVIRHMDDVVLIEDILDTSDTGELELSLADFRVAVARHASLQDGLPSR